MGVMDYDHQRQSGQNAQVNLSHGPESDRQKSKQIEETAQQAIDVFLFSKQPNGDIGGIGYWQVANGYTAIALHDLWATKHIQGDQRPRVTPNANQLKDLLAKVQRQHPGYINEFNDDTLWWAHCLFQLHKLSGESTYIHQAVHIWRHVSNSVVRRGEYNVHGMDMEGGVFWATRKGEDQLNSITTGLYSELSSLLLTVSRKECLTLPFDLKLKHAAEASLSWIIRCRYRQNEAIVTDTIKLKSKELVDWTFTYNTGQAIAACVALYDVTRNNDHLRHACDMAQKSLVRPGWVEQNGVLTESGAYGPGNHEAWKNDDAVGFKSVLVRGLAKLYQSLVVHGLEMDLREKIKQFILVNYRSHLERNTNGKGQYGPWWNGPMALPTSHSQLAVLDVMAAVMLVKD